MISLPIRITDTTQAVRGQRQGQWTAAGWERLPDDSRAFSGDEVVVFDCLPGLSAPVSALFVGAPDTTL